MRTNSQEAKTNDYKLRLETLLAVAESLGHQIHLDELLRTMVSEVTAAMRAERSSLLLYDSGTDELYSKVAEGMQTYEIRIPLSVGVAGATARTRMTINMPDAYRDPRFDRSVDLKTAFRTRSILSTPIIGENQRLIGVVQVLNKLDGTVFTADDEALLHAICTHLRLAIERAELVESYVQTQKLQQSLQLAREIQMGLLPQKFPAFPNRPEIDVFATIKPALDVGGDLYDFFLRDDDHLCFVIGDVSDKGIPAALFMAVVRTAFRISAMATQKSIDAAVRTVNEFIAGNNDSQMFVTMLAGIMDLRTGTIEYVDGGHEPPFIVRRTNAVETVEMDACIALGVMPEATYHTGVIQLHPGDALVLYTDGVNEAMNMDRQQYHTATIGKTLETCYDQPAATISRAILDSVDRWVGGAPQSDDITMLVIRYCGPSRPALVA
jgi:serine phosphatase RsbU (regulator of sigma subunit)